jgi:hypothetical protein
LDLEKNKKLLRESLLQAQKLGYIIMASPELINVHVRRFD